MSRGQPTKFGSYLRAARLGFHWSSAHRRFIRMSHANGGVYLVEVCTEMGLLRLKQTQALEYIVWWEVDAEELLSASPVLLALAREPRLEPSDYYTLTLNDAGERA